MTLQWRTRGRSARDRIDGWGGGGGGLPVGEELGEIEREWTLGMQAQVMYRIRRWARS